MPAHGAPPGEESEYADKYSKYTTARMKAVVAPSHQRKDADIQRIPVVLRPGARVEPFHQRERPAEIVHLVGEIEKADVVVVRVRMVPRAHARQQQEQRHAACQQKALAPGRQLHAASTARETS